MVYTYNEYVVLGALRALDAGEPLDRVVDALRYSANRANILDGGGVVPVKAPPFNIAPPFILSPRGGQVGGQIPPMPSRVPAIAK